MRTGTSLMLGQERGMSQLHVACLSLQTIQVKCKVKHQVPCVLMSVIL